MLIYGHLKKNPTHSALHHSFSEDWDYVYFYNLDSLVDARCSRVAVFIHGVNVVVKFQTSNENRLQKSEILKRKSRLK